MRMTIDEHMEQARRFLAQADSEFAVAEKFHANFYHGFMEPEDWTHDSPIVKDFAERMLALVSLN